MTSFKEDEEIFKLISEILETDEMLEKSNPPMKVVGAPDNKREKLQKRSEELYRKLITSKIEIDRIRIRETPYHKAIPDFLRNQAIYGPVNTKEEFENFWEYHFEEILEFHQDNELIERGSFARNYFKLIPPYVRVGTKIPEGIKNIYHESRWCYVYGQYSASIALSRTVIETVLKSKFNITGNLDDIINTAKNRTVISPKAAWNANKVRISANKILHKAEPVEEKEAKNAIDHILKFLEEIYL